jgi:hypothetical protein
MTDPERGCGFSRIPRPRRGTRNAFLHPHPWRASLRRRHSEVPSAPSRTSALKVTRKAFPPPLWGRPLGPCLGSAGGSREAAKRGLGAEASCWRFTAKARSSQQGASAPRPRFDPRRLLFWLILCVNLAPFGADPLSRALGGNSKYPIDRGTIVPWYVNTK